jgi:hypothetical protein
MNQISAQFPEAPKGYREAYQFHYPKIILSIASILSLVVLLPILITIRSYLNPWASRFNFATSWADVLIIVATVLVVIFIHEWLHGITYQILGYRVKYGFNWKLFAAYACAYNQFQQRKHNLIVAWIPLIVINVISLPLLASSSHWHSLVGFAALLFNTSGAVGDLYLIYTLLRLPERTLLYDIDSETMLVYEPITQ